MITTPKLGSGSYPDFIRRYFAENKDAKAEKVFPKIGLRNCTHSFKLASISGIKDAACVYIDRLREILANEVYNQKTHYYYYDYYEMERKNRFCNSVNTIIDLMKKDSKSFIKVSTDKIELLLPKNVEGFPAGSDLFSVITNLRSGVPNLNRLDSILAKNINSFSILQPETTPLSIIFSGAGDRASWDIATMSMRGITSCQRWGNEHAYALIGSMIDPYAGILYIASNASDAYGKQMIKRSVVRFVIHKKTHKPAILIERIYPHDYNSGLADIMTLGVFVDFLKKKTKEKFPVIYGENNKDARAHFIPITKFVSKLPNNKRSYRDSKIAYKPYKDVSKVLNDKHI